MQDAVQKENRASGHEAANCASPSCRGEPTPVTPQREPHTFRRTTTRDLDVPLSMQQSGNLRTAFITHKGAAIGYRMIEALVRKAL
jgi:hypothetical protein